MLKGRDAPYLTVFLEPQIFTNQTINDDESFKTAAMKPLKDGIRKLHIATLRKLNLRYEDSKFIALIYANRVFGYRFLNQGYTGKSGFMTVPIGLRFIDLMRCEAAITPTEPTVVRPQTATPKRSRICSLLEYKRITRSGGFGHESGNGRLILNCTGKGENRGVHKKGEN